MTTLAYAGSICVFVATCAALDHLWLNYIRPRLTRSYGWPKMREDERIPPLVWVGVALGLWIVSVLIDIAVAVGF